MAQNTSLIHYLAYERISQVTKKGFFGGPYILAADYLLVAVSLYECGALIGRAASFDQLTVLAKMFTKPGADVLGALQNFKDQITERTNWYSTTIGGEAGNFYKLVMPREHYRVFKELPNSSSSDKTKRLRIDLARTASEDVLTFFVAEGLCFGNSFPQTTEMMYREGNENFPDDLRAQAIEKGLFKSLEIEQKKELLMLSAYVHAFYPQFVQPLLGLVEPEA